LYATFGRSAAEVVTVSVPDSANLAEMKLPAMNINKVRLLGSVDGKLNLQGAVAHITLLGRALSASEFTAVASELGFSNGF
jgi:hypothetical protein